MTTTFYTPGNIDQFWELRLKILLGINIFVELAKEGGMPEESLPNYRA